LVGSDLEGEGSENTGRIATWGRRKSIQKEGGEEMRRRGGGGCHRM